MVIIKEEYEGSIEHFRKPMNEFKKLCIENDFELESYVSDSNQVIVSRGEYSIIIELNEVEKEAWGYMFKNGRPIYRQQLETPQDLGYFEKFVVAM